MVCTPTLKNYKWHCEKCNKEMYSVALVRECKTSDDDMLGFLRGFRK